MEYTSCQVCGLKYRGGYARMRCPSCERRHAAMKSRISHIRSECGVEPVACPICGKMTDRDSGFCLQHEADRQKAIAEWTEWCKGVRAAEYEKIAARCKLKDEKAAATATKEASNMEKNTTETSNMYVLTVVGGAPIYWFDSEDKAFAVCDALTDAAEASGFAAKYDVTVIKKWVA